MSRILRRPMFRGGRVDSRGTGITTGLDRPGMQGGGMPPTTGGSLLQRATDFFTKPALGPDGKPIPFQTRNFAEDAMFFLGPGKFLKAGGGGLGLIRQMGKQPVFPPGYKAGFPKGMKSGELPQAPFLSNQYFKDLIAPYTSGARETLREMAKPIKEYSLPFGIGTLGTGYGLSKMYEGFKERQGGEPPVTEEGPQDDNSAELAAILNKLNADKKKELESKLPTEEDLEINKEKYSKLLGGDKARGEDISNMLLSFAGKALAPEADVKSAFGEFAAEQAKTPSKKSKVDESAAALAINEYIAGKKSKAELDRFFAEMDYKKSLASRAGPEYVASNIAEASKSASGYKAIELGLQISFPEGGRPVKIEKGQANEVPLTLDNLNKVFIEDEAPYTAVQIVAVDGKLVRNPVY